MNSTSFTALVWHRFRRHRLAVAGALLIGALLVLTSCAELFEMVLGVHSTTIDLNATLLPPLSGPHFLGTDELGRDVLMRLLHGGRVSLAVGVISALAAAALGTSLGMLAGYYGGLTDLILMRIADAMLSIPVLPLLIVLSAVDLGKLVGAPDSTLLRGAFGSVAQLMFLIVLFGWMTVARLARAATLQLRNVEYVLAARALGASHFRILRMHILPGALPSTIVAATLEVGGNILYEASLSFLGLGVKPPVPSWGNMLTNAQDHMYRAPLLAFWPGLLILLTVTAFNFLGDGLRDALDPKQLMKKP